MSPMQSCTISSKQFSPSMLHLLLLFLSYFYFFFFFFFSSRRRHTRYWRDWSSDVCSSDLRTVCSSFFSNGRSIFSRRRLTRTSTTLVWGSKLYSHTWDRIMVFETTCPA